MKYLLIYLFLLLSLSNCSNLQNTVDHENVYLYSCDDVQIIYIPSDSLKIYIYTTFFKNEKDTCSNCTFYYRETELVDLLRKGIITNKILTYESNYSNDWLYFEPKSKNIIKINADSCFNLIDDNNMNIYELMQTNNIHDEYDRKIFEFQIVRGYGTVHDLYQLIKISDDKYGIKYCGSIL